MWYPEWKRNQQNSIAFVMVDSSYTEVPGLGAGLTLEISKNGAPFAPAAGVQTEIGSGWYFYTSTAAEANTIGPIAIRANGAGCIQQNGEYVVQQRNANCIEYTYTVTNSVTLLPEADVAVWFSTDLAGANIIWNGITDVFGIARDDSGNLPCLDAGTYYAKKHKPGVTDDNAPADVEIVS